MAALDDDYDLPPGIEMPAASALPRCWPETDVIMTEGERRGRTEQLFFLTPSTNVCNVKQLPVPTVRTKRRVC